MKSTRTELSRRNFLKTTAVAGVGLTLNFTLRAREASAAAAFEPNAALTITPDGIITVHITKAEMGQGVGTALAQIVAEELEADWKDVRIDYPMNDPKYGLMLTGGSWSVNWTFDSLSRAGAGARMLLTEAAAKQMNVAVADCVAEDGRIRHLPTGRSMPYGEIVAKVPITRTLSEEDLKKIELKKPSQYRIIGKWIPRLDIPEKVTGKAKFGIDTFLPGMVYAKVAYPPTREGGKHTAVDDTGARKVKGWIQTVVTDDVVAVVADTYDNAVRARDALRVSWDPGPNAGVSTASIFEMYAKKAKEDLTAPSWVEQVIMLETALIAREVKRPVKLIRSREEDLRRDYYRSATLQVLRGGLSADGKVIAWENTLVAAYPGERYGGLDDKGRDQFALNGSDHVYEIPNQFVRAVRAETGMSGRYLRAGAPNYTFFALETFIHEIAHLAKADPVQFRLAMLGGAPRLARVLKLAADRAGWDSPLPPNVGRGVACVTAQERKSPTWTASVVETQVDPASGAVKVRKIVCAESHPARS